MSSASDTSLVCLFPALRRRAKAAGKRGLPGLATGFAALDEAIGGWRGLGILGGNPGARKTTLLHYCGCRVVELNEAAFFAHVTFEMPPDGIVALSAAIHAGTEARLVERGALETEEGAARLKQAQEWVERYGPRVHIWGPSQVPDVATLGRLLEELRKSLGLGRGFVVIDSVQRMATRCARRSEKEAIDDTVEHLHALAHETNTAIAGVSHVTKKGFDGDTAFPFAGSGGIDHLADYTATLVTSREVTPKTGKRRVAATPCRSTITIRKNRLGRENCEVVLAYDPGRTCFEVVR